MDPALFTAPEAGRVVRVPAGYFAFIPAPLPPPIAYDADLVLQLSRADAALGELSGVGRQLPNPHLLIAPYMRREAVLSSRIEGTRATLSDLLIEEAGGKAAAPPADVQEVMNYVAALEYGMQRLQELPLSVRLVREMHGRLMSGVRGEKATPGEFRRSQNWIGPLGSTLSTAAYIPPPHTELADVLSDWERFLHMRNALPDLIQCAVMHEQFEAIHPFLDGNGRVGRLLITLFLLERKRLPQPLLYLSAYIEARRDEYYALLQRVRTQGDWASWIRFFLVGVTQTAEAAMVQARELMDLREAFRAHLRGHARALELVDHLFVNPYISVGTAEDVLRTSNQTARQAVRVLEEAEILQEVTGRKWGRLYVAKPIHGVIMQEFAETSPPEPEHEGEDHPDGTGSKRP